MRIWTRITPAIPPCYTPNFPAREAAAATPTPRERMKQFDKTLTSGSLFHSVWKIAWPVVLLNLINGMPPMINQMLIGHFEDATNNAANSAVGTAWQVFLVIVVFISSIFHGMNVLVSQAAGRHDRETLSRVVYQAFLASIYILPLIVAPLGIFGANFILTTVIDTPPAVAHFALPYLRILFAGGTPMFLMFLLVNAFQSAGEQRLALVMGVFTAFINLLISAAFIIGVAGLPKLGALGAAVGNVAAPSVSVVIALVLIARGKTHIQMPKKFTLIPDFKLLGTIARIGVPSGIQGVVLNVGGVLLIRYINHIGDSAVLAAYTICYQYVFNLVSWTSFGLRAACATLMGQNIGAGDPARGKKAVSLAARMGALWAACLGLLFWFAPHILVGLFSVKDGPVMDHSIHLLHFLTFSGIILATGLAFTGGLQGAGQTTVPMVIAILTQIFILLGICQVLVFFGALTADRIWMAILTGHLSRLILTYAVFRTDGWAFKRIEVAH